MSNLTVTDKVIGDTVVVHRSQVAVTIADWFPELDRDVSNALNELQYALNDGEPTQGWEDYLGIAIEPAE